MKVVALIPARGGSKGIPNKNLKLVGGIPLVARSVLAARGAKGVEETFVSSDSKEILSVAHNFGAVPILRPQDFAQDQSSTEDVLIHFLGELEKKCKLPEILVYLQCTSPFTTSKEVQLVLAALIEDPTIDCAFSVTEDHSFLWTTDESGIGHGVNHIAYSQRKRRQDLGKTYKENGAVYAIRTTALKETSNRFGRAAKPVPIKGGMPFEIDDIFELQMSRHISPLFGSPAGFPQRKSLRAVVMDFDGVLTNDKVSVNELGQESIVCSRADGLGIGLLKEAGFKTLIITREQNPVVLKRAAKIGVEIISSEEDKLPLLKSWAVLNNLKPEEIVYVGNDVNDLDCLSWSGLPVAPLDAHSEVIKMGVMLLNKMGGDGVIRALADTLISKKYPTIP